jgi:hypothetical protein
MMLGRGLEEVGPSASLGQVVCPRHHDGEQIEQAGGVAQGAGLLAKSRDISQRPQFAHGLLVLAGRRTYSSTCVVVLPFAVNAMWENAESGVAPCQCFSSEGM